MTIKISAFPTISTVSNTDVLPIIDVSEPAANQNKKVTVASLIAMVPTPSAGNPYLQTNLTGAFSPNIGIKGILLGEDINLTTNIINNAIVVGNDNTIASTTGLAQVGNTDDVSIFGSFNEVTLDSDQAVVLGSLNKITSSRRATIVGTQSNVGNFDNGYVIQTEDATESFLGGVGNTSMGINNTVLGSFNTSFQGAFNSVIIGTGSNINELITGLEVPVTNEGTVMVGAYNNCKAQYGTIVGSECTVLGEYGTALGAFSAAEAPYSISIGGSYAVPAANESITIGNFSYTNGPASIAIGARSSANSGGGNVVAIGNNAAGRAANCTVLGANNGVAFNAYETIAIGNNSGIFTNSHESVSIGNNNRIYASGAVSIGYLATIYQGAVNSIAIGRAAEVTNNAIDAIQLGTGTNGTSNTLQFLSQPIANNVSVQIATQTTNVAPTSSPPNGTMILDQTGNGTLWVRVNNIWKSVALS